MAKKYFLFFVFLTTLLVFTSCGRKEGDAPAKQHLKSIIENLKSKQEKTRYRALDELRKYANKGLSPAEGKQALEAAALIFPPQKYESQNSAAELVSAAAVKPYLEYAPIIEKNFSLYAADVRVESLRLLSTLKERAAIETYMKLLRSYAPAGKIPHLATGSLEQEPRYADLIFPELLTFADIPNFEWSVYVLCLEYFKKGLLSADRMRPYVKGALKAYRKYREKLMPLQRDTGIDWMWAEAYQEWRGGAGLLLDVLGYFGGSSSRDELRNALNYSDPRLKFFAALSLLRMGEPVAGEHFLSTAASAEMRKWLFEELKNLNRLDLFPPQYANQEALAESEMVDWLIFPTELGRVPDGIELMKVYSLDAGPPGGLLDYYLFRFKTHPPHWAAEEGWLAGIAGPYRRREAPTAEALGSTFSQFHKWEDMTADEHFKSIVGLQDEWAEKHQPNR